MLTGDQKARLVQVGTRNTDAYNLYLKATDVLNRRDYKAMGDAIGWLEQAAVLDPDFAQAHARLAMVHVLGWAQYGASENEAERQAKLAYALDPKLAETQYALGFLARKQRRLLDARVAIELAIALAPNDASANFYYAQQLINTGYTRQGIVRLDRALAIDPMLQNALHWRALQYLFAGDADTAEQLWKRASDGGLSYADVGLASVARARGDFAQARALSTPNLVRNVDATACLKDPTRAVTVYFEGVDGGDAVARAKALAVVEECLVAKPDRIPLWVTQGLHHLDTPRRTLQVIALGPTTDDAGLFNFLWSPSWTDVRKLPEFPDFARKVGFADVWDRYGPPDNCQRNAPGDYVCN
jgi:tetratricopeptide (TPR) repeat protein